MVTRGTGWSANKDANKMRYEWTYVKTLIIYHLITTGQDPLGHGHAWDRLIS